MTRTAIVVAAALAPSAARADKATAKIVAGGSMHCAIGALFDHRIGARQQSRWNVNSKRTGSLQVEDEFKFARLQNRKVRRFNAFEDAAGIDGGLAENIGNAGSVTHQQAGGGGVADKIAGRYAIAC